MFTRLNHMIVSLSHVEENMFDQRNIGEKSMGNLNS